MSIPGVLASVPVSEAFVGAFDNVRWLSGPVCCGTFRGLALSLLSVAFVQRVLREC